MKNMVRCLSIVAIVLSSGFMNAESLKNMQRKIELIRAARVGLFHRLTPSQARNLEDAMQALEKYIADQGLKSTSDSKKRRDDIMHLKTLMTNLIVGLTDAFSILEKSLEGGPQKGDFIDPEKLLGKKIKSGWHFIKNSKLSALSSDRVKQTLQAIQDRSEKARERCAGQDCKDKFIALGLLAGVILEISNKLTDEFAQLDYLK